MFLAYAFHRAFLLGETPWVKPTDQTHAAGYLRFFGVTIGITALLFGGAAAIIAWLYQFPTLVRNEDAFITTTFLLLMPFYLIILSLLGTALPAAAIRESFGLGLTLRRAKRTFFPTMFGLLLGPGLFGAAAFLSVILVPFYLSLPSEAFDATGVFSPIGFAVGAIIQLIGFVTTILAVAVLCRVYRQIVPEIAA